MDDRGRRPARRKPRTVADAFSLLLRAAFEERFGSAAVVGSPLIGRTGLREITCRADGIGYRFVLDSFDGYLDAYVEGPAGRLEGTTSLPDVVELLSLGNRHDIRASARTQHALSRSVDSQLDWALAVHRQLRHP